VNVCNEAFFLSKVNIHSRTSVGWNRLKSSDLFPFLKFSNLCPISNSQIGIFLTQMIFYIFIRYYRTIYSWTSVTRNLKLVLHQRLKLYMIDSDQHPFLNRHLLMSLSQFTVRFKGVLKSTSFPSLGKYNLKKKIILQCPIFFQFLFRTI
jgi:hypothetical protein